jgi:hypothetical protein
MVIYIMILSVQDKNDIISRFPYKYITHDRVLYNNALPDIYIMIPSGIKGCLWFSMYNNQPIMYELYLTNACKIYDVVPHFFVGDHTLCRGKGTICSGYSFAVNKKRYVTLLDIMMLCGNTLVNERFETRMEHMLTFFNLIQRDSMRNTCMIGMVDVVFNKDDIPEFVSSLKYKVSCVLTGKLNQGKMTYMSKEKIVSRKQCIFNVKADYSSDIYELYCNDCKDVYAIAGIQTIKTSIMMNTIFRNIRENANLDLLEESDEETDDYLLDNISPNMVCIYNNKINKWVPSHIVDNSPDDMSHVMRIQRLP